MKFLVAVLTLAVLSSIEARTIERSGHRVVGFRGKCYFSDTPLPDASEAQLYLRNELIGKVTLTDVTRSAHQVQIVECGDASRICFGERSCFGIHWLGRRRVGNHQRVKREYNGVRMQYDSHGRIENYSKHTVQDPYADGIGGWPLGGYELLIGFGILAVLVLIIVVVVFHNHMPCSKRPERQYYAGGRGEDHSLKSDY